MSGIEWSHDELETLRAAWVTGRLPGAIEALPHRTIHAVRNKATVIGLLQTTRRDYSLDEDEIVRAGYPNAGPFVSLWLPSRTRRSVIDRAARLGVKCGRGLVPTCAWCSAPATTLVRDGREIEPACTACAALGVKEAA